MFSAMSVLHPASRQKPTHNRRRRPDTSRRRALELLASCGGEGCTEALMLAHGFTTEQMVELVRAGLATARAERVIAGRHEFEVARVRITEAGRQVLASGGITASREKST
jgi:hypothetical protein